MILKGLREVNSSELMLIGGATKTSAWTKIVEKIRSFFDFLADYIPQIVQGFVDGFAGKSLI